MPLITDVMSLQVVLPPVRLVPVPVQVAFHLQVPAPVFPVHQAPPVLLPPVAQVFPQARQVSVQAVHPLLVPPPQVSPVAVHQVVQAPVVQAPAPVAQVLPQVVVIVLPDTGLLQF